MKTMFGKLKLGDRFQKNGFPGIYSKTSEKEAWSPNGRAILFSDSEVYKESTNDKKEAGV